MYFKSQLGIGVFLKAPSFTLLASLPEYAATKAGIIGFTKSLAKELGKRKITVNAVAPGFIKSELTDQIPLEMLANILALIPLKEMGSPEDVANTVKFLASDEAKWITGGSLIVDGGFTLT